VTRPDGGRRVACATLTYLAEPADPVLGFLLRVLAPDRVLACIRAGAIPAGAADVLDDVRAAGLRPALARWRAQLPAIPPDAGLAAHAARDITLVCPGELGWPPQRDDLGAARPYALWVRGTADLRSCCARSVAIVGARAATAYGRTCPPTWQPRSARAAGRSYPAAPHNQTPNCAQPSELPGDSRRTRRSQASCAARALSRFSSATPSVCVARLPEDGRCVLAGGDGLLEPPNFPQGLAEVVQGDALAVPVPGLPADRGGVLLRGDGPSNRRTYRRAVPRLFRAAPSLCRSPVSR
jgi:hypothetical protein